MRHWNLKRNKTADTSVTDNQSSINKHKYSAWIIWLINTSSLFYRLKIRYVWSAPPRNYCTAASVAVSVAWRMNLQKQHVLLQTLIIRSTAWSMRSSVKKKSHFHYLHHWNEVNIEGDYGIGRSVRVSVILPVCLCTRWPARITVAPSCENYIGGYALSRAFSSFNVHLLPACLSVIDSVVSCTRGRGTALSPKFQPVGKFASCRKMEK